MESSTFDVDDAVSLLSASFGWGFSVSGERPLWKARLVLRDLLL